MDCFHVEDCGFHKNGDTCEVYEYPSIGSEFDLAVVRIFGKYPDGAYCVNSVCKEVIYIIEGEGVMYEGEKEHKFRKGDVIVIKAGERFRWEANCVASISCTPPWNVEQYKLVQE